MNRILIVAAAFLLSFGARAGAETERHPLPEGFVYLDVAIPDIAVELRYFTSDNFVGRPVDGYVHAHAILSKPAAAVLARVQETLRPFGLGLKVFDAYRPQRAVDHFVRWAADLEDRRTKPKFYPNVAKKDLFREGYIAARSSHSRGSTVDVTIVFRAADGTMKELDMGSSWDFFGPVSWPTSAAVSAALVAGAGNESTGEIKTDVDAYAKQASLISLESIGYYSDKPGSQKYPWPLNMLYPDTGDFIHKLSQRSCVARAEFRMSLPDGLTHRVDRRQSGIQHTTGTTVAQQSVKPGHADRNYDIRIQ